MITSDEEKRGSSSDAGLALVVPAASSCSSGSGSREPLVAWRDPQWRAPANTENISDPSHDADEDEHEELYGLHATAAAAAAGGGGGGGGDGEPWVVYQYQFQHHTTAALMMTAVAPNVPPTTLVQRAALLYARSPGCWGTCCCGCGCDCRHACDGEQRPGPSPPPLSCKRRVTYCCRSRCCPWDLRWTTLRYHQRVLASREWDVQLNELAIGPSRGLSNGSTLVHCGLLRVRGPAMRCSKAAAGTNLLLLLPNRCSSRRLLLLLPRHPLPPSPVVWRRCMPHSAAVPAQPVACCQQS